jgi:hypothetical protein
MGSARRLIEPRSRLFSAVEVILTAPLGSALIAAHPNRASTEATPVDGLKQQVVKVGSTDRDRVIKPAA